MPMVGLGRARAWRARPSDRRTSASLSMRRGASAVWRSSVANGGATCACAGAHSAATQVATIMPDTTQRGSRPIKALIVLSPKKAAMTARATRVNSARSEEHTSELQSLMRISYAVFCLKKKKKKSHNKQSTILPPTQHHRQLKIPSRPTETRHITNYNKQQKPN